MRCGVSSDSNDVLVVDLDGTLVQSDMLYESFWSTLGRDCRAPLLAVRHLKSGKAELKQYFADNERIDATTLPYDPGVIEYIKNWRDQGGRTALVTATDRSIAKKISDHLGLFDEFYGSDGKSNLKGKRKASFLEEHYGKGNFAYMGDAFADIPVWNSARKAITVNASPELQSQAESVSLSIEHLHTHTALKNQYLMALRPHQWLKNMLVFVPMMTAHQFDGKSALLSLLAFVAFGLIASGVYVLNDLLDLSADRAHPRKRQRPFASGAIPISSGTWMIAALLLAGSLLGLFVGTSFFLILLAYFTTTSAYSLYLKRQIILDICILAGLYTMRLVAGAAATDIPLSVWLLAFSIFFFLSLAAVKRQAELVDSAARGVLTTTGRGYHVGDLSIISMIAISAGYVSVLVMALYVSSPTVVDLYAHPKALWGVCAVLLFWITRTVMVAHRGKMHDDPVVYAAKDRVSRFCFLLILVFAMIGLIW